MRLTVIVGGLDKVNQGAELSRTPHIVVATPGRLADILETSPEFTLKRYKRRRVFITVFKNYFLHFYKDTSLNRLYLNSK